MNLKKIKKIFKYLPDVDMTVGCEDDELVEEEEGGRLRNPIRLSNNTITRSLFYP